jgi:DNA invertase Pin-like site-specific DNA recombinase
MRFVAYYRVSKKLGQEYGIDAQIEAVSRYLKSLPHPWELVASYQERESGAINDRAQLRAALEHARHQRATLIIAKLDRLSRDAGFLITLQNSGCDFICCDMPHADKFTVGILALVAQRERELISERTKAGLAVAKARGVRLGNPNAAKAWNAALKSIQERKHLFALDAFKAIKEIQGTGIQSLNRIADCLNKRGEKTALGKRWTHKQVARVLKEVIG